MCNTAHLLFVQVPLAILVNDGEVHTRLFLDGAPQHLHQPHHQVAQRHLLAVVHVKHVVPEAPHHQAERVRKTHGRTLGDGKRAKGREERQARASDSRACQCNVMRRPVVVSHDRRGVGIDAQHDAAIKRRCSDETQCCHLHTYRCIRCGTSADVVVKWSVANLLHRVHSVSKTMPRRVSRSMNTHTRTHTHTHTHTHTQRTETHAC